ncbi:MAG: protein kinase, partial [Planctomycetota bacterium]|nr:protein kinase [Planctomycetota bacterium]
GLAAAHYEGIIHRDIKPDNILLPAVKGGPELDFRAAKLADLGLARAEGLGASLTATQATMGSPGYMAPEQATDARAARKPADVFSMGATLYALLAGQAPFRGETPVNALIATVQRPHEPIRAVNPAVSEATAALLDRCLAKEPAGRYVDALALLEALNVCRAALSQQGIGQQRALEKLNTLVRAAEAGVPVVTPTPATGAKARPAPPAAAPAPSRDAGAAPHVPLAAASGPQPVGRPVAERRGCTVLVRFAAAVALLACGGYWAWIVLVPQTPATVDGKKGPAGSEGRDGIAARKAQEEKERKEKEARERQDADDRAWAAAEKAVREAGEDIEKAAAAARDYLAAHPNGAHKAAADTALADCKRIGEERQAGDMALRVALAAKEKDQWDRVRDALEEPFKKLPGLEAKKRKLGEDLVAEAKAELGKRADFEALLVEAQKLLQDKKCDDAKTSFEKARDLWPQAPRIKDVEAGLAAADEGLARQRYDQLMVQGMAAEAKEDWRTARELFERAANGKPKNVPGREADDGASRARYQLALAGARQALKDAKWADAEEAFREALKEKPQDQAAEKGLSDASCGKALAEGQQALKDKKWPAAEEAFKRVLEKREGDAVARQGLADARYGAEMSAALAALGSAKPDAEGFYAGLTEAQYQQADEALARALKVKPEGPEAKELQRALDRVVRSIDTTGHTIMRVIFFPDGQQVLSACAEGVIQVWDIPSGSKVKQFHGTDLLATHLHVSPDGKRLVARGYGLGDSLWDLEREAEIALPKEEKGKSLFDFGGRMGVLFSPDGRTALRYGIAAEKLQVWNTENMELVKTLKLDGQVQGAAISPDATHALFFTWKFDVGFFMGVSEKKKLSYWDLNAGREVFSAKMEGAPLAAISFSRDGSRALAAGADKRAHLWDLNAGKELLSFPVDLGTSSSFSPDGRIAVTGNPGGSCRLWDLADGTEIQLTDQKLHDVDFTPDGRQAVFVTMKMAAHDMTAACHVWDIEQKRQVHRFVVKAAPIMAVAVSPDGRRVVLAGPNKILIVSLPQLPKP